MPEGCHREVTGRTQNKNQGRKRRRWVELAGDSRRVDGEITVEGRGSASRWSPLTQLQSKHIIFFIKFTNYNRTWETAQNITNLKSTWI